MNIQVQASKDITYLLAPDDPRRRHATHGYIKKGTRGYLVFISDEGEKVVEFGKEMVFCSEDDFVIVPRGE